MIKRKTGSLFYILKLDKSTVKSLKFNKLKLSDCSEIKLSIFGRTECQLTYTAQFV